MTVYNLEVEDYHTYFVGDGEVLVHNKCTPPGKGASGAVDDVVKEIPKTKPEQVHHYASNKNQTYTPQFKEVANKYNLDLDDVWNKELLPHQGRHPNAYHDYVLENMKQFDNIAQGNKDTFMRLYESMKSNIKSNPDMLYKDFWTGK